MKRWLILAGLLCSLNEQPTLAQIFTNPVIIVASDPSGACPARRIALSIASGKQFWCDPSTNLWSSGISGGGGSPGTPANSFQFDNAGAFGGSAYFGTDEINRRTVTNLGNQQFNSATPTTAITAVLAAGAGVDAGTHSYVFTCLVGTPESAYSPQSNVVTTAGGNLRVTLTVPLCVTGGTARKAYRTFANDTTGEWFEVPGLSALLADNTTVTVTDSFADSTLTNSAPQLDQTGANIYLGTSPFFNITPRSILLGNAVTDAAAGSDNFDGENTAFLNRWSFVNPIERTTKGIGNSPYMEMNNAGVTNQAFVGLVNNPAAFGVGSLTNVIGQQNSPSVIAGLTVADVYGVNNIPALNASTVTNMYGDYLGFAVHGGATVTNQYAIFIESIDQGTNNWAIKTGLGKVELGDDLLLDGKAFASLGTPSNGTQQYCTDCKVTSGSDNTCASGGSGAAAFRINGVWACLP